MLLLAGCMRPGTPPAPGNVAPPAGGGSSTASIMGANGLTGAQLAQWFQSRQPQPSGAYAASVPVATLAQLFVEEGNAEGVRGDIAFIQGIVETAWYRFSGTVPAWKNNFAGIGATDTNPAPAAFPDARTGARAQIQHLRAYADPTATTCAPPVLHNPCVDPRFNLVTPKGRATSWYQMGNGNWASSSTYSATILRLYNEARAFFGVTAVSQTSAQVQLDPNRPVVGSDVRQDPPVTVPDPLVGAVQNMVDLTVRSASGPGATAYGALPVP